MTYEGARDGEQLARLQNAIGSFISRYKQRQSCNDKSKNYNSVPAGTGSALACKYALLERCLLTFTTCCGSTAKL